MRMQAPVLFLTALFGAHALADVYRVRNTNDSGTGSLRWAIEQANSHAGRDKIVFAARLAGKVIRPLTALPRIEGSRTVIDGDINADGRPDIALNGKNLATGPGLRVHNTRYCRISGLAIVNFPSGGIALYRADYNTIRSCHVGVALAGTKPVPNGADEISMRLSSHNTIGGSSVGDRNVIGGGEGWLPFGIRVYDLSHSNTIAGNYIGLTRDGMTAFGGRYGGVQISDSSDNTISGNVLGGFDRCVELANGHNGIVVGNYFGLAADGDSLLPINVGVVVREGSTENRIGGTTAGARNVFAGNADKGVQFVDNGTEDNRVQGNYFGLNAAGTAQRRIRQGVTVTEEPGSAGPQIIGGGIPSAGNYFTPKSSGPTFGVVLGMAGHDTIIRHNTFGVLPNGTNAAVMYCGVGISGYSAIITDNILARAERGISVSKDGISPRVWRNAFRACGTGVYIDNGARCRLGNLGNPSTADDGGNIFRNSNTWHIRNFTDNRITAEGNSFGTTSRAAIDAKIWDRRDDNTLGRVDFNPLAGGVIPTGETAPLTVASATALPTRGGGAEIAFSLSAPADVTVDVLNIAGRSVATVVRGSATNSGLQRVIWSGQTGPGTRAPSGTYLVRIVARDEDGQQVQSLCSLQLSR